MTPKDPKDIQQKGFLEWSKMMGNMATVVGCFGDIDTS